jgi:hypothetical protein
MSRWSVEKAIAWKAEKRYRAGCNYITSTASNALEMFQEETYDSITIKRELNWAREIGFNIMRVYLHNFLWDSSSQVENQKFLDRLEDFLAIANEQGMLIIFVFFDSCWSPNPGVGPQPDPIPGVHNSRWVQSPGTVILHDDSEFDKLQNYVQSILTHFKEDPRIFAWDLWNEPDNSNYSHDLIYPLLEKTFSWAREVNPSQPLTTPVWNEFQPSTFPSYFQKLSMDLSDIISFHHYGNEGDFLICIKKLQDYSRYRPLVCTEYLARTSENNFNPHLKMLKDFNIDAINWGFVAGKTQTYHSWETSKNPCLLQFPNVWLHDILYCDGRPYQAEEIDFIKSVLK